MPVSGVAGWTLSAAPERSNTGAFALRWQPDDGAMAEPAEAYRLEERAETEAPRTLYRGPDTASFLSGKPDGDYIYRVEALDDQGDVIARTEPVTVEVEHQPLTRAFAFFTLGLFVFGSVVVRVFKGAS